MKNVSVNGLTTEEVLELQKRYGKNEIVAEPGKPFLKRIIFALSEPVFLLLFLAALIYFLLGEPKDGLIMLFFVLGIVIMDVLQEWKTDKALSTLRKLSDPMISAVRNKEVVRISGTEIVPGDIILAEEGCRIPADGYVLSAHDFCIDESLLTGEATEVWKIPVRDAGARETQELALASFPVTQMDYCYAGTMVIQGNAVLRIHKTGNETIYGKIGVSLNEVKVRLTPLQKQMKELTKTCTIAAVILFFLVSLITYFNLGDKPESDRLIESFLSGIVLTLSMIPAEFPVILTVFLSMGALRLTKKHALVRKLSAVETLGTVSVICVDKTGTITKNQMSVQETFCYNCEEREFAKITALACDSEPHDPMEKAILTYCDKLGLSKEEMFSGVFLKGYPFSQECKAMTHVWKISDKIFITAKGSPEWLLQHSTLSESARCEIEEIMSSMFRKGLRVLAAGVMVAEVKQEIPVNLKDCCFTFCGLMGFKDPPKDSIQEDLGKCREAGIRIIMITGDNGDTAASLAEQIEFPGSRTPVTGMQIASMTDEVLKETVKNFNIFSRVIPDQKLRIVNAIIENGEITAMTGDGVNDAPALKRADIGIAMGLRGSEVTKEAADLILLDDNFSTIVESIEDGRRIYANIKKAIGYVLTIHIPIALICLFGPLLHIFSDKLMLLPLHVVLLELIMNPTCAAAIGCQPAEKDIMKRDPRNTEDKLLSKELFIKSLLQGVVIFIISFGSYYGYLLNNQADARTARTIGLGILIVSNLFLIIVNASGKESSLKSIRNLGREKGIVIVISATFLLLLVIIYGPLQALLKLKQLNQLQFLYTILLSFLAVFWYEIVKMIKCVFFNRKKQI